MSEMKKPESGGTPKTIDEKLREKNQYGPGGPYTPGAKKKRRDKLKRSENRQGKLSN